MPIATPITQSNLDMIAKVNGGVRPSQEAVENEDWYVDYHDDFTPNEILSKEDMFRKFKVPAHASPAHFVPVTRR
jgi:hypothetical protein